MAKALNYAELHSWSNFTFLEGASHPEELVERACELGLRALALTDRDGLYGSVRFASAARRAGLDAIIGAELTFDDKTRAVVLVENAQGYANCCELISTAQLRGSKGDARLQIEDFDGRSDGLVLLTRTLDVERASTLRAFFGERLYLELQQHLTADDAGMNEELIAFARRLKIPYVATNAVAYARREEAPLADVLACVKETLTLEEARAQHRLRPNAEYHLKPAAAMRKLFAAHPEAVDATLAIAERCAFRLERLAGQFPLFPVPDGYTRQTRLRELVYQGAVERYGSPVAANVERQLEYELGIIAKMDLAGYFLIVWDIVQAANRFGVLCQGRGSAANSAVCYALGITAVDPIGMNLLFERFMSEERQEIPDIDIDFAHQDREKVIQYIYERYGRSNAAMAAEVVTFRTRSALRDVGKALGLTLAQVDAVVREFDARESLAGATGQPDLISVEQPESVEKRRDLDTGSNARASRLEPGQSDRYLYGFRGKDFGADPDPNVAAPVSGILGERLYAFCRRIDGFPRHMGIHSGGMVITRDPLVRVAPVEWATMKDRTIIQWDKDDLQELGLIKIDLLGLGMLSLLREAFTLHERCHPERSRRAQDDTARLALHTIPPDDKPTYEMISRADTIGVFQIESRAQQSMLPRMKPACFYDIVMQVAIIRPGPIQGQMIHPFLRRRSGMEPVTYPHPKLKPV
ncbi:MAG: DNA polymerase III subunit alpha, partial [Candidatus Eremiobacteraeota bacterium]|nr:DNA polymerase III subunit alpha [Candidatus Eremiobacteraeota bacterium]